MSEPAIKTTVVGSYPIPAWLAAMPSVPALRDAMLVVIKTQELAGIDVIADGELSRFNVSHPDTNGMIDYFVGPMSGVHTQLTHAELQSFRARDGMAFRAKAAGVVREAVGHGSLDLQADWQTVRDLSDRPMKFTVTSPYMLAKTLVDHHYQDVQALSMALAEVLAKQIAGIDTPVLQVDEANLTGHPGDADWAHEPINRVLDAVSGECGLHLCFGNYGGQSIQQGFWQDLMPFLNQLHVDHLVLEFARRGYEELDAFAALREDIALGIGAIDIKDNEVESADTVARRIQLAVEILGADRIKWVHPDCGFWMLQRSVADRKMAALVAGRDQFLGG
ncbi:MAG: methionine synthase [Planctomycetaceae bacterium]|jgi:5-methyltetrahydropteroyltriglutamate--homocysteine methyltransferase|nr:methionine synthase [Planctomycetaceae bacterium]